MRHLFITAFLLFFLPCSARQEKQSRFVIFSPPKCGTHLIAKAVEKITGMQACYNLCEMPKLEEALMELKQLRHENKFLVAHNFYRELLQWLIKKKGYKVIFPLRDPRDQLISTYYWLRQGQWPWLSVSKIQNKKEQLDELITGKRFGYKAYEGNIGSRFAVISKYSKKRWVQTKFEALVGPEGGGSTREVQIEELCKLARFLEVPLTGDQAETIAKGLFGKSITFRKGSVGQWKEHLDEEQIAKYKAIYGKTLIQHGYEKDTNW